jgi:hypothetical protein
MSSVAAKPIKPIRSKRTPKVKPLTKFEMLQKMIADQKLIRECIQQGMTPNEITKKYGFRFATI